jgi:hypothetical protein
MLQFRNQSFAAQVLNLTIQAIVAWFLSNLQGYYWYWLVPAVLLVLLPRVWKNALVTVNDVGVKVGGKTVLVWGDTASLAKRGWTRAVFNLKDGSRRSLQTFDWPAHQTEEFHALLQKKGLKP